MFRVWKENQPTSVVCFAATQQDFILHTLSYYQNKILILFLYVITHTPVFNNNKTLKKRRLTIFNPKKVSCEQIYDFKYDLNRAMRLYSNVYDYAIYSLNYYKDRYFISLFEHFKHKE